MVEAVALVAATDPFGCHALRLVQVAARRLNILYCRGNVTTALIQYIHGTISAGETCLTGVEMEL